MGLRNKHNYNSETTFFITTTCKDWLPLIEWSQSYEIVKTSLKFCQEKYKFELLGYVIMPNHMHLILHKIENVKQRSDFMRDFKKFTSTKIRKIIETQSPENLEKLKYSRKEQVFKVWQDRFDEYAIQNIKELEQKLNYIHQNPMQTHWNLTNEETEYKWSSARFYFKQEVDVALIVTHYMDVF